MPSSLTNVDVTPNDIATTPALSAITYHASVTTIHTHVTVGTNNGSDSDSLDSILEIIEITSPPAATVSLSYLCEKIHNSLLRAQGYIQEKVSDEGSPNTVSATSEPSFLDHVQL